jgi:TolB-like protein
MRYTAVTICLLTLVSLASADPTTQPAMPATQPTCDVYIAPFTALGDNSLEWAGKAVSQNLLTDLARKGFHPLESDKPVSNTDALAAGKAVNAKFLITGTYQTLELQVRFNGQIIDVNTGNVLGGLSVTGAPRDLFALEDSLSAQAINQLSKIGLAAAVNKPQAPLPPALQQPVLVQLIQPPAVAAPNAGSSYEGSALQAYVEGNRTPSTDFAQQVQNSQDQQDYASPYYGYGYGYGYSPYFGGYGGYGIGFYVGIPSGGYGFHSGGFHGNFRVARGHDHAEEH